MPGIANLVLPNVGLVVPSRPVYGTKHIPRPRLGRSIAFLGAEGTGWVKKTFVAAVDRSSKGRTLPIVQINGYKLDTQELLVQAIYAARQVRQMPEYTISDRLSALEFIGCLYVNPSTLEDSNHCLEIYSVSRSRTVQSSILSGHTP